MTRWRQQSVAASRSTRSPTPAALREVARMRSWPEAEAAELADVLIERIRTELGEL